MDRGIQWNHIGSPWHTVLSWTMDYTRKCRSLGRKIDILPNFPFSPKKFGPSLADFVKIFSLKKLCADFYHFLVFITTFLLKINKFTKSGFFNTLPLWPNFTLCRGNFRTQFSWYFLIFLDFSFYKITYVRTSGLPIGTTSFYRFFRLQKTQISRKLSGLFSK